MGREKGYDLCRVQVLLAAVGRASRSRTELYLGRPSSGIPCWLWPRPIKASCSSGAETAAIKADEPRCLISNGGGGVGLVVGGG